MSESMREEFEAWLDNAGFEVRRYHHIDGYHGNEQMAAWEAWQASRASLCVELPADCHLSRDGLDECHLAGQMRDDIIEAIRAAGVKTK